MNRSCWILLAIPGMLRVPGVTSFVGVSRELSSRDVFAERVGMAGLSLGFSGDLDWSSGGARGIPSTFTGDPHFLADFCFWGQ
jgi:hypothetical protein